MFVVSAERGHSCPQQRDTRNGHRIRPRWRQEAAADKDVRAPLNVCPRMPAMTYAHIFSLVFSLFPCVIPPYAFRLNRVFGTKRVGWVLFTVFSLLAALQVVRSWHPMGLGLDPGFTLDLFYLLIPVLLLIGMVHIETLFKERMLVEQEEKRMRSELELQVKERTAALDKSNQELQEEISLRKRGEEELRKSKEQYRFLFDENPQPMWIFDLRSLRFL